MTNATDVNDTGFPPLNPDWGLDITDYDPKLVLFYENIPEILQPWTEGPEFLPTTVLYSVVFLCGLLGNGFAMFVFVSDKSAHTETNAFLVSLASADLLFLIVCIPYEFISKTSGYLPHGSFFCKLAAFVEMFTASTTIWNLTAVSIERFVRTLVERAREQRSASRGSYAHW